MKVLTVIFVTAGVLYLLDIPQLPENPKTPLPNGAIRILPNG